MATNKNQKFFVEFSRVEKTKFAAKRTRRKQKQKMING